MFTTIYISGVILNLIFLYSIKEHIMLSSLLVFQEDEDFTDEEKITLITIACFLLSLLSLLLLPLMLQNYLKNK